MIGAATARRLIPVRGRARSRRPYTLRPRMRRRLLALGLVAAVLAGGHFLWLRDSFLVAVQDVSVTGVRSGDSGRVAAALGAAARESSTLHVDRAAIERAAEAFPTIRALRIEPDFPHGLRIAVIEHSPAAILTAGDSRVPVAEDGSILAGMRVSGSLPAIEVDGVMPARRLAPGVALDAVRVAGGAPAPLAARLESVGRERGRGFVVRVADGPDLIFGGATRIAAKWAAAARVLADRHAAGADYVDLRIPERPAAGGLPVGTVVPVAPAGPTAAPVGAAPAPAGTLGPPGSTTGQGAPARTPAATQAPPAASAPAPSPQAAPPAQGHPSAGAGGAVPGAAP